MVVVDQPVGVICKQPVKDRMSLIVMLTERVFQKRRILVLPLQLGEPWHLNTSRRKLKNYLYLDY